MKIDLPDTIAIFPLPGILLFPRAGLPLHIFEPRYRALMDFSLACNRMIGIIQPRPLLNTDPASNKPELFRMGCLGEISSWSKTPDGRYYLVLNGVCRFNINEELPMNKKGFRLVKPDFQDFGHDLDDPKKDLHFNKTLFLDALKAYIGQRGLNCNWEDIQKANKEDLINGIAMSAPFPISEKQALLEEFDLESRATLLLSLLKMDSNGPNKKSLSIH